MSSKISLVYFGLMWASIWAANKTFTYFDGPKSYENAQDDCLSRGGGLAVIETQAENDAAWAALWRGASRAYIGLSDRDTEGSFQWIDETPLSFSNWLSGEPNFSGGDTNCAGFHVYGGKTWDDYSCSGYDSSSPIGYVCQYEQTSQDYCTSPWSTPNSDVNGDYDCWAGSRDEKCTCSQDRQAKMTGRISAYMGTTVYEYTCAKYDDGGNVGEYCGEYEVCSMEYCTSPDDSGSCNAGARTVAPTLTGTQHEPCTCSQGQAKYTGYTHEEGGSTFYGYTCCTGGPNAAEGWVGEKCGDYIEGEPWWGLMVLMALILFCGCAIFLVRHFRAKGTCQDLLPLQVQWRAPRLHDTDDYDMQVATESSVELSKEADEPAKKGYDMQVATESSVELSKEADEPAKKGYDMQVAIKSSVELSKEADELVKNDDMEAASGAEEMKSVTIDKNFNVINSFQWLKWTFPCLMFTALMLAESLDYISDVLQWIEVNNKFNRYTAPPFVPAGTSDREYSVQWERVRRRDATGDYMLGFSLPWNGNPSGARKVVKHRASFFELDCLANGVFQGDGHKLFSNQLTSSARGSEYQSEEICAYLPDVFHMTIPDGFPKPFPTKVSTAFAICPNNATGIFDENSFKLQQTFNDNDLNNKGCDTYGCGKDLYVVSETKEPLNMLERYRADWGYLSMPQCNTLYGIHFATGIFFGVSSICVLFQGIKLLLRFRSDPPDAGNEKAVAEFEQERVQALVEFPLIGFLLALIYLDEEGWDTYAEIDYAYGQSHPEYLLISRILGFHDRNNLLYIPIWPYYQIKGEETPPKSVTLGQKLFHSFLYPLSHGFKEVMIGNDSFRYLWLSVYYCVLPAICAWCFIWFCVVSVPLCMIILAYSDKLLLGRIIFDVPNFCLALTYILVIESNFSSALSVAFSGFFMVYYLSGMVYQFFMDMLRTPPPELFPICNCYGKVTGRGEAIYQAFVMPFIEMPLWTIIIPLAFTRHPLIYASPDDDGSNYLKPGTTKHLLCSLAPPYLVLIGVILITYYEIQRQLEGGD